LPFVNQNYTPMKNFHKMRGWNLPLFKNTMMISGLLCLVLFFAGSAHAAEAEAAELGSEDKACQSCHDSDAIKAKITEAGESLSMRISTQAFLASMHNETSCTDCHEDADGKDHGKVSVPMKSKRDYRLSFQDSCTTCHKKSVAEFKDSVHAILVKEGSDKAPTCSDCHNPHTVRSVKLVEPIANVPCANCHKDIFKAYSQDVHGLERVAKGKSAPLCADCHKSHAIQAASLGDGIRDACLTCHKDAAVQHEVWLPNSRLHFKSIECQVCHAPNAQRRVNLRMVDSVGGKQLVEQEGAPRFERLSKAVDGTDRNLNESEMRGFLKAFNLESPDNKAVLSARLELSSGLEAHQLSTKDLALKDCQVCHRAGAAPFSSVILTMAGSNGRALRQGIDNKVLTSATSFDSLRGFYAIGSTRIKLLDYLLVLVILGVLCVPIAHLTVNRLFKAKRDKLRSERQQASTK